MAWIVIPNQYLVNEGQIKLVEIENKSFCVVYHIDKWVAFSKKCPHAGALLSNGWCEDGQVICPLHRHSFSLETGKGKSGQHNYITIYPTKLEDGLWKVYFEPTFWKKIF